MKKTFKFKSDLLNEQLSKGYLGIMDLNPPTEFCYKNMVGISGNCVVVMLFPNGDLYNKSLKPKMIYHLKKEGFVYSSHSGQFGYYIKGIE
jgi:hypothetical protein